jgi:hypothetical protein
VLSPPALGYEPLLVDVNHDAHLDLILADQDDGVVVSLGQGDGRFDAPRQLPHGARIGDIAAGDADADGNNDLLAANMGLPDAFDGALVTVLFGEGDGTFVRRDDVPSAPTPRSLAAFDADGDGVLDIAAGGYAAPVLSVSIGTGAGTFLPASNYAAPDRGTAETIAADFNGDGQPDIATCGAGTLLAVFTNAAGTFAARTDFPATSICTSMAAADFNLDGRLDLAMDYFAASPVVSIFLNTTTAAGDTQPPTISAAADPSVLWPANGRTIAVVVSGTIADDASGLDPATLAFTVADEYEQVQPSGTFTVAADGRYSFAVPLTASRRGNDRDGRTYRITIAAADAAGNEATTIVEVLVPHDRGNPAGAKQ